MTKESFLCTNFSVHPLAFSLKIGYNQEKGNYFTTMGHFPPEIKNSETPVFSDNETTTYSPEEKNECVEKMVEFGKEIIINGGTPDRVSLLACDKLDHSTFDLQLAYVIEWQTEEALKQLKAWKKENPQTWMGQIGKNVRKKMTAVSRHFKIAV